MSMSKFPVAGGVISDATSRINSNNNEILKQISINSINDNDGSYNSTNNVETESFINFSNIDLSNSNGGYGNNYYWLGDLYDDYDSSISTTLWDTSGSNNGETTEYIEYGTTSEVNPGSITYVRQKNGFSEDTILMFRCNITSGTYNGSKYGGVYFSDGTNRVSIRSMNLTGLSSNSYDEDYIIFLDYSAQTADIYIDGYYIEQLDLSSLTQSSMKLELTNNNTGDEGVRVRLYDYVTIDSTTTDKILQSNTLTKDSYSNIYSYAFIPYISSAINSLVGITSIDIKNVSTFESCNNNEICELSSSGTGLTYKVNGIGYLKGVNFIF